MSLREDLIESAVEFLKDPSISDSPLNKRIEFIESKGLTKDEIQELLKRAQQTQASTSVSATSTSNSITPAPGYDYYPNAPPIPEKDWKDYFIMATTTVGLTYGIYQVVSRYVLPNIMPASKDKLEQEKEAIDQEFGRIEKLLETLETQQNEFIETNNAKATQIDDTLASIDGIISKTNEKNLQNEESLKYLKLEVENIKSTMVSSLDSQKSVVLQELSSLEQELADLKKILLLSEIEVKDKTSIQLKPEEKLKKFNIPPASSVPSASDILEKSANTTKTETGASIPDWQKYADDVQRRDLSSGTGSPANVPALEPLLSVQGIPAWQLRS